MTSKKASNRRGGRRVASETKTPVKPKEPESKPAPEVKAELEPAPEAAPAAPPPEVELEAATTVTDGPPVEVLPGEDAPDPKDDEIRLLREAVELREDDLRTAAAELETSRKALADAQGRVAQLQEQVRVMAAGGAEAGGVTVTALQQQLARKEQALGLVNSRCAALDGKLKAMEQRAKTVMDENTELKRQQTTLLQAQMRATGSVGPSLALTEAEVAAKIEAKPETRFMVLKDHTQRPGRMIRSGKVLTVQTHHSMLRWVREGLQLRAMS